MKRKLDMCESSNIKCEHCRFLKLEQNGQDHKEEMYHDGFIAGLAAGATEIGLGYR